MTYGAYGVHSALVHVRLQEGLHWSKKAPRITFSGRPRTPYVCISSYLKFQGRVSSTQREQRHLNLRARGAGAWAGIESLVGNAFIDVYSVHICSADCE